jgi:cytochrome b561
MPVKNTTDRFGAVAQLLHWLIAAMIVMQWFMIEWVEEAEHARKTDPAAALEQLAWMTRHKAFGMTILGLAIVRLLWRFLSPPPAWPAAMPAWQVWLARGVHYGFYLLLFALPISGWLYSSAANRPVSYFGLFTFPDLVAPDKALRHTMHEWHEIAFNALFALAIVHVLAALKHQFVDKDGLLGRMLPWRA